MNKRITPRERGLLKGALRRVFSRSDLRRKIIDASVIEHSDPTRPRVKKWCRCNVCKQPEAKSYTVVDHLEPVVSLNTTFEEQGLDKTADRLWCDEKNLQSICEKCHDKKTAEEKKQRKLNKKRKKRR